MNFTKTNQPEVVNFGCRLNSYESEVIKEHATNIGLKNVVIINSCAVTSEAERQVRQKIRKLKRNNSALKIVVTGCAAQVKPHEFAAMPEVYAVVGNQEKLNIETYSRLLADMKGEEDNGDESLVDGCDNNPDDDDMLEIGEDDSKIECDDVGGGIMIERNMEAKILVNDIMSVKDTAPHLIKGFEGKVRGFLQVQNGCNHRCTFCIIPYGRGNSRSVPLGDIVMQAQKLVEGGCKEVVLTGVDITDYGLDLPGSPRLGQMVRRLLKMLPDLLRLRLSSIDVAEIDDDLLWLLQNEERFMPHLHLSLQSGDNMILKRMKRRHTREQVIDFCAMARKLRHDLVFGADVIAGFPTETDEMFENSYSLIGEANIMHLHVFPYSERSGTPAARMPQVKHEIRKARAEKLRELGRKLQHKHYLGLLGSCVEVLDEGNDRGRTKDYGVVRLKGKNGELVKKGGVLLYRDRLVACKIIEVCDSRGGDVEMVGVI